MPMAAKTPQSTPTSAPTTRVMATGTVRVSTLVSSRLNRKSFQVKTKAMMAVAANSGAHLRQANPPQDPQFGAAVEARGLFDRPMQFVDEALQHPDRERQVEGRVDRV